MSSRSRSRAGAGLRHVRWIGVAAAPARAVWLLPTPEFRRAAFESRGSTWTIPNKTSDPQRALANLLARDQLFTEELRAQTRAFRLQAVDLDGSVGVAESVARVGKALGL